MSRLTEIEEQLAKHASAVKGIETIVELAKNGLSGSHPDIASVLGIVLHIGEAVLAGFDGKMKPDQVNANIAESARTAISDLDDQLAQGDEKIDKSIDDQFPKGE